MECKINEKPGAKDLRGIIKRLKKPYSDTWRNRIGALRLFYKIDEKRRIVSLIAASHRSRAY